MAQASTRITRKNIRQPDRFLVITGQVVDFVQKQKRACIFGLAGFLVLSLAVAGWSLYRDRQDRLAATDFEKGRQLFRTGRFHEAVTVFETVKTYSSSSLTPYALLYQANSHLALNESAKAVEALEALLSRERKSSVIRQLALITLGYAHEVGGEWKQAAQSYGEAVKIDGPYKEDALLSKARCEAEAKDYKAALESYQSYLSTYPNATRSLEASLKAQELQAKLKTKAG